jgi:glutamine amidotransferase
VIAVVDYGAGNLASVVNALTRIGAAVEITHDAATIRAADGVIVPGVGAAADTMGHLTALNLDPVIRDVIAVATPYLGICMGMQALLTTSLEGGEHRCLDVVSGTVRRLPGGQPIPHMGWNQVWRTGESPLFTGIPDGAEFYFVHSYYVDPSDPSMTVGETDYGVNFASIVAHRNIFATQFHPEKSGRWGLQLLANFVQIVEQARVTAGAARC